MNNAMQIIILFVLLLIIRQNSFKIKSEHFIKIKQIDIDKIMDVYVINLKHRTNKRDYMKTQLNNCNLKCKIFEAIDGSLLNLDSLINRNIVSQNKSREFMKREMRRGEIGCALSHILIWHSMLASEKEYFLIFEDDAILVKNFKTKLLDLLQDVSTVDWDILYLNKNCNKHFGKNCVGKDYTNLTIHPSRIGYGLYGYVINKKFAEKCFNKIYNDNIKLLFPLCAAIDVYVDYKGFTGNFICIRSKETLVDYDRNCISDTQKII